MKALAVDLRLALRDLRGTLRHFSIFLACIALAVFAIAGIANLADSLVSGLNGQARTILGGDVSFAFMHREASDAERAYLATLGALDSTATLRAMARSTQGDATLVEIKAVEPSYPPLGQLTIQPPQSLLAALRPDDGDGILIDPALMERLNLHVGERLIIGTLEARIHGTLESEPDQLGSGLSLGPRVLMSQPALRKTGLLQPGALVRWTYRLGLTDPNLTPEDAIRNADAAFPQAGWQSRSRQSAAPQFENNIARFADFLTLVGLTALLVGGAGVGSAVQAFVMRKRTTSAILKAVGASGRRVMTILLLEILLVTTLGIGIGLVAAFLFPHAVKPVLPQSLSVLLTPRFALSGAVLASLFGYGTALIVAVPQLARAGQTKVSALFRDGLEPQKSTACGALAVSACLAFGLFALAVATAQNHRLAAAYLIGASAVLLILRILAKLLMLAARRFSARGPLALRLALRNIDAPRALTPALTLAVGLGLTLLVTIALVDANLRQALQRGQPGKTPSFFFLDIRGSDAPAFSAFLQQQQPMAKIDRVAMMRGRIIALNAVPVEKIKAEESAAWVLEGDRGITFSDLPPQGTQITQGEWWPQDYKGEPLVSLEQDAAAGLHLKLGDTLTVNVLGRPITARIQNLRKVDWRSFGINFVMVFSPNTFAGAPTTFLATLTPPDLNASTAQDQALIRQMAQKFPSISAIRVKEALETAQNLLDQLTLAIRAASSLVLISALLVLAGALNAAQNARAYEATILKTLGATRSRLLLVYGLEFTIVSAATALLALSCGILAAYLIVNMMKFSFFIPWSTAIGTLAASIALVTILGLLGTWRSLGEKPARRLRTL